jgi:hypothetical protein
MNVSSRAAGMFFFMFFYYTNVYSRSNQHVEMAMAAVHVSSPWYIYFILFYFILYYTNVYIHTNTTNTSTYPQATQHVKTAMA